MHFAWHSSSSCRLILSVSCSVRNGWISVFLLLNFTLSSMCYEQFLSEHSFYTSFVFNAVVFLLFCCIQKEKITSHPPLKKLKSLNDLDQANDDQEIEFLKLQVLEQQSMIDELTRVSTSQKHEPGVTAVSTKHPSIISFLCMFQDREKLLRKKRHKRSRPIKVSV